MRSGGASDGRGSSGRRSGQGSVCRQRAVGQPAGIRWHSATACAHVEPAAGAVHPAGQQPHAAHLSHDHLHPEGMNVMQPLIFGPSCILVMHGFNGREDHLAVHWATTHRIKRDCPRSAGAHYFCAGV